MIRVLTFDIEEWFHCDHVSKNVDWERYEVRVLKSTDKILNSLNRHNQKATFFCLGWVARKHPRLVKMISDAGHEIGCHSDKHELLTRLNIDEFRIDTADALKCIEDITGEKVKIYRAPAFSITRANLWVFEVLMENNIEVDCSIFPAKHDYGGFESFGSSLPVNILVNGSLMKEFPINTISFLGKPFVFSGGGFFRFFPYWFIRYQMLKNDYVITYFHPRDFDPDLPAMNQLPKMRKFKSYYGLEKSFSKFEKLLSEFSFITVGDAVSQIDWTSTGIIKL